MRDRQTTFKQNINNIPSSSARNRVQEIRNQFFKKANNNLHINSYDQPVLKHDVYKPSKNFTGLSIQNQINNDTELQFREKRNYSALKIQRNCQRSSSEQPEKLQNENLSKKQNRMRREFDLRVGNINKLSSKIEDLLQYVKHPRKQNKNPVNEKSFKINHQKDNTKSMRQREIKIIKENYEKNNKDIQRFSYSNVGQKEIEKPQTYLKKIVDQQKDPIQQLSCRKNYRRQELTKKYDFSDKNFFKKVQQKKSIIVDYEFQEKKKYPEKYEQELQSINVAKKINRQYLLKEDKLQPEIHQSQRFNHYRRRSYTNLATPKKQKDIENNKSRKLARQDDYSAAQATQNLVPQSIMESQITKIKARIQQSEKQRKKLQQKYYQYSGKVQVNKFSYSNIQQAKIQQGTAKVNGFQLKIYPCQMTIKQSYTPTSGSKKASNKLAQTLGTQISFDQKLKSARQKFSQVGTNEKWVKLKEQLQAKGLTNVNIRELQEDLSISTAEHNPFDNSLTQSNVTCIEEIADCYFQSQKFWNESVNKCVCIKKLNSQNFNIRQLDLQKKGYLSVQDFVCFINLYTGSFYRNRDVMMIFKRFIKLQKKSENVKGVQYQTFIDKVCDKI